jgi:hypothetical protein
MSGIGTTGELEDVKEPPLERRLGVGRTVVFQFLVFYFWFKILDSRDVFQKIIADRANARRDVRPFGPASRSPRRFVGPKKREFNLEFRRRRLYFHGIEDRETRRSFGPRGRRTPLFEAPGRPSRLSENNTAPEAGARRLSRFGEGDRDLPNFQWHVSAGALTSAVCVAFGSAIFKWDSSASSLAFLAGLSGSLIPDLDSDASKPLRLSGVIVGLGCAASAVGFVSSKGAFLHRPWAPLETVLAAVGSFFLFNTIFVEILKKRTKHRGLFHSLAVPFLYAGLWAALTSSRGPSAVMACWITAAVGVFTHLLLDAAQGMTFNPLKVATADLTASTKLWILTALINFLAFTSMSVF